MVKSGRSISLESQTWIDVEDFANKEKLDISSACEILIKTALKKEREKVK